MRKPSEIKDAGRRAQLGLALTGGHYEGNKRTVSAESVDLNKTAAPVTNMGCVRRKAAVEILIKDLCRTKLPIKQGGND